MAKREIGIQDLFRRLGIERMVEDGDRRAVLVKGQCIGEEDVDVVVSMYIFNGEIQKKISVI